MPSEPTAAAKGLGSAVRPSPRRRHDNSRRGFGIALVAPYVVLLAVFGVGPVGYAIVSSIGLGADAAAFAPYIRAITDFRFLPAMLNVALFLAVYLPVIVGGVVLLSLLVDSLSQRFGASLLLIYTIPGAVTGAAAVLLWYFMLQPALSPFAPALNAMGFTTGNDVFQNRHLVVLFSAMAFAAGFGQWMLITTGALKSVSEEVLDAARIDGCSAWQTVVYIKLPLMGRTLLFMLILTFASAIQIFAEPQILNAVTGVGSKSWSLNQLGLTYAFSNGDFARAAALSILLFVVCLLVAAVVIVKGKFLDTEHQK